MSINHTILGMLSCKPLTGYDLKKIMQDSSFMPWSGNNNQIYKALLELHDNDFVTSEVFHQDSSPSKKVYTITPAGLGELRRWTLLMPEGFETKKPFLLQLAWADLLSDEELQSLLDQYEQEIQGKLRMEQKKAETGFFKQSRTLRETALWDMIGQNILLSYESELEWIGKAKTALAFHADAGHKTIDSVSAGENDKKAYQIVEKQGQRFIFLDAVGASIQTEKDVSWLLAVCVENRISHLLIDGERLSDDFLRLQTGLAGIALQKFATYGIRAATVLDEKRTKGKFRKFLSESGSDRIFRSFVNQHEAKRWLLASDNGERGKEI